MASASSQPQFRYTQPPSKVLHLRNLPWECTEEELIELGNPFGRVVNTRCNVGANRNQAFIEFAELNQAIAMISYYASSSEPAQANVQDISSMAAYCIGRKSACVFLIPELGPCTLKITYSSHTELSVKFQSYRSRDYTNSLLPVATSAIDASGQFSLGGREETGT